jgi:NAD(P)H-flavin reductase
VADLTLARPVDDANPRYAGTVVQRAEQAGLVKLVVAIDSQLAVSFHAPGQYHRLGLEAQTERAFFAPMSPAGETTLEYLFRPHTPLTSALASAPLGSKLTLHAAEGDGFDMTDTAHSNVLLVGTGTGISPLLSLLRTTAFRRIPHRSVELLWGLRHEDQLKLLPALSDNVKFTPVVSQASPSWSGLRGHLQSFLSDMLTIKPLTLFLCGQRQMTDSVSAAAMAAGVAARDVRLNV